MLLFYRTKCANPGSHIIFGASWVGSSQANRMSSVRWFSRHTTIYFAAVNTPHFGRRMVFCTTHLRGSRWLSLLLGLALSLRFFGNAMQKIIAHCCRNWRYSRSLSSHGHPCLRVQPSFGVVNAGFLPALRRGTDMSHLRRLCWSLNLKSYHSTDLRITFHIILLEFLCSNMPVSV